MAAAPPSRSRPRHPGAARAWAIWWLLLAGLWLALVDTVARPELVAGAAAAAIGATGAVLVRNERRTLLRPRAAWIRPAGTVLARAVADLAPLGRALWARGIRRRAGAGTLVEVPYAAVGDGPEPAAHRAFTQALGSFAPNTIVVDVDRERGVLRVHQLVATDDAAAAAKPLPEP